MAEPIAVWSALSAGSVPTEPAYDRYGNRCTVYAAPETCQNPLGCRVHHSAYCGAAGRIGRCYLYADHEQGHIFRYVETVDGELEWRSEGPLPPLTPMTPQPRRGDRIRCLVGTQTGRYLGYHNGVGWALYTAGGGLFVAAISLGEPDTECLVPSDDALAGTAAVLRSGLVALSTMPNPHRVESVQ